MLIIDTMTKDRIITMIAEIFINIIHPMPFFVNETFEEEVFVPDTTVDMRVDSVLLMWMSVFRSYHFFRPLLYYSYLMDNRAFRI